MRILRSAARTSSSQSQLAGRGTLHSFATVHLHQDRSGKGLQAPFTVGLIVLDDGPAVRSTLTERTDAGLHIGDRMHSRARCRPEPTSEGKQIVELRFAKTEAAQ